LLPLRLRWVRPGMCPERPFPSWLVPSRLFSVTHVPTDDANCWWIQSPNTKGGTLEPYGSMGRL
jgi:hypothetical protein